MKHTLLFTMLAGTALAFTFASAPVYAGAAAKDKTPVLYPNTTRVAPRTGNRVTRAGRAVSRAVGNAVRRVSRRSVSRRRG